LLKFKAFRIQNARTYQDVTVPLADQGIVSINGANGVGKSTVWDLLQAVNYGSTPEGHRRDEIGSLFGDTVLTEYLDIGDIPYEIVYKQEKGRWAHKILKSGEDITPHGAPDAAKLVRNLIGLSQEEFQGSVHLTQNAQHTLISGAPSERKQYMAAFFGIDNRFDPVHDKAKGKLEEVQGQIANLKKIEFAKDELARLIEGKEFVDDGQELTDRLALERLITELRGRLATEKEAVKSALLYEQLAPQALKYPDPEALIGSLESAIAEARAFLSEYNSKVSHNEKAAKNNALLDAVEKEIATVAGGYPEMISTPREQLEKAAKDLAERYRQEQSSQVERAELAALKDAPTKVIPVDAMQAELFQQTLQKQSVENKLRAIASGKCPTCEAQYSTNDVEALRAQSQELGQVIQALQEDINSLTRRNQVAARKLELQTKYQDFVPMTPADTAALVWYQNLLNAKTRYDQLASQKAVLVRMDLHELPNQGTQQITATMQSQVAQLTDIKACASAKGRLPPTPAGTSAQLQQIVSQTELEIQQKESELRELTQWLGKVSAENMELRRKREQLASYEQQLASMADLVKREFFWKKMVEAYGPKGLRVKHLSEIMDLVLARLPVYTSLLFKEKELTFDHECDGGQIEIYANRKMEVSGEPPKKSKKKLKVLEPAELPIRHSISSLSGGEKKRLSVAFVVTLADCIPTHKRANILILDEIDASLDEFGQHLFANELLPALRDSYESVFVISHSAGVRQAAVYDQIWTVTKENHKTSLMMNQSTVLEAVGQ
jgi:DNA repair exonuclease SbcCD ATPase subunit